MAKATKPLTDNQIKRAKIKDKDYKLYDGNGLLVLIRANGKKVFRVKYKALDKYREITLGNYPALSLINARKKALEIKQKSKEGIDIIEEKKKKKAELAHNRFKTFKDVANEFFLLKEKELAFSHIKRQKRRAENYIFPFIANKDISTINKSDILSILKSIDREKAETIKRIFLLLKQIYTFALHNDYSEFNPLDKIDINSIAPKKKVKNIEAILDLNELNAIYKHIGEYNNFIVRRALQFQALTALRTGSIRNLRWEYIDYKNRVIIFPPEAMKGKKEFRLPLTDTLIDMLKEIEEFFGKIGFVFSSPIAKSRQLSENTLNYALKRLGIEGHTTHSWRSAFSTNAYELQKEHNYSVEVIESQLAHSIGNSVTRAYMRSDFLEERRGLLEWWESKLRS